MVAKKNTVSAGNGNTKALKKAAEKTAKLPVEVSRQKAEKSGKPPKAGKESIRFPAEDYALFATLKARAKLGGRPAKKGELVRAGLRVLTTLDEAALIEQLRRLDPLPKG